MKTKTYLRYISCVLAVLLCVASIMPIAFADSTNHGNSESLLTGSNYSVSYSMNGKDVVEQLTIRDGGITRITRTVHPNEKMLLNSLQFVMEVSHELRVRCILMM